MNLSRLVSAGLSMSLIAVSFASSPALATDFSDLNCFAVLKNVSGKKNSNLIGRNSQERVGKNLAVKFLAPPIERRDERPAQILVTDLHSKWSQYMETNVTLKWHYRANQVTPYGVLTIECE